MVVIASIGPGYVIVTTVVNLETTRRSAEPADR
jgi:hypothetical protein